MACNMQLSLDCASQCEASSDHSSKLVDIAIDMLHAWKDAGLAVGIASPLLLADWGTLPGCLCLCHVGAAVHVHPAIARPSFIEVLLAAQVSHTDCSMHVRDKTITEAQGCHSHADRGIVLLGDECGPMARQAMTACCEQATL